MSNLFLLPPHERHEARVERRQTIALLLEQKGIVKRLQRPEQPYAGRFGERLLTMYEAELVVSPKAMLLQIDRRHIVRRKLVRNKRWPARQLLLQWCRCEIRWRTRGRPSAPRTKQSLNWRPQWLKVLWPRWQPNDQRCVIVSALLPLLSRRQPSKGPSLEEK